MANTLYSNNLVTAAQYAYDNRLSKPYTNHSVSWDWEHNGGHGIIQRPNHGLAHSARGATYAPTVVEYFKNFAADKENYQFSQEDIEKIQIALMFRVTGRENDAGFSDDPVSYAQYQKAHAKNFREYCQAHPEVFKDNAEIDKYANILETYAKPDALSPLALIFKTCHNLDLLRVRDPAGMEKELKEPMRVLGRDNVQELMVYADECIRATGNRILCSNPMVGKPAKNDYGEPIFSEVSTNVAKCFQVIAAVPQPKRIQALKQAKQLPLESILKIPHTVEENGIIATSLLAQSNPVQILRDLQTILENQALSAEEKAIVYKNNIRIFESFLTNPLPPETFKTIVDYLAGDESQKNALKDNYLVLAFNQYFDAVEKAGLTTEKEIQSLSNRAKVVQLESIHYQTKAKSAPATTSVNSEQYITSELAVGLAQLPERSKQFAQSLKANGVSLLANVKHADLVSPFIESLSSTAALTEFSTKLQDRVISDILEAKSLQHQDNMIKFYHEVMLESMRQGDFNSTVCIANALKSSQIQALIKDIHTQNLVKISSLDSIVAQAMLSNTEALHKQPTGTIPIFTDLIASLKPDQFDPNTNGFSKYTQMSDVINRIYASKEYFTTHPIATSMDISQIDKTRPLSEKQKEIKSSTLDADKIINLDHIDTSTAPAWGYGSSIKHKIDNLLKVLNKKYEIPINAQIHKHGKKLSKEESVQELLSIVQIFMNQAIAQASNPEGKEALEKLAIATSALDNFVKNENIKNPLIDTQIASFKQTLTANGIGDIEKVKQNAAVIKQWLAGQSSVPKNAKELEKGPLPKNPSTQKYEDLVKGMLAGDKYTVQVVMNASTSKNEAIITMNGEVYNLQQIMKYANPNHVKFTDEEKKAYVNKLKGKMRYAPEWPNGSKATGNSIDSLDATFISSDPTLTEISQAERLAINIYTTGFYTPANSFLRGLPASNEYNDPNFVWEVVCHSAMGVSGLNGLTNDAPEIAFRGEADLPQFVLDQRIQAAKTGGVTNEAGFISTAQDTPETGFMSGTGNKIAILFKDLKGKNVKKLSAHPNEREFLMPPTQIQWVNYVDADGVHYLEGRPATTPQYMPEEALLQVDQEAVAIHHAELNAKKAEQALVDAVVDNLSKVNSIDDLMRIIQEYQSKGINIINDAKNINRLEQFFRDAYNDPLKVETIASQGKIPSYFDSNIINPKFSAVNDKFIEIISKKCLIDSISPAKTKDEFIAALNNYPGPIMHNGKDIKIHIIQNIERIFSDKWTTRDVANDPIGFTSYLAQGGITKENGLFDKLIEIAQRQVKNDAGLEEVEFKQKIKEAKRFSELDVIISSYNGTLVNSIGQPMSDLVIGGMLGDMQNLLANKDLVAQISANPKNYIQYLSSKNITGNYGIRDKFIELVKQQHQLNIAPPVIDPEIQFREDIKAAPNFATLMSVITNYKGNLYTNSGKTITESQILEMVNVMQNVLNNQELVAKMADKPYEYTAFLAGQGVTSNYNIRDKFVELVKQQHNLNVASAPAKIPSTFEQEEELQFQIQEAKNISELTDVISNYKGALKNSEGREITEDTISHMIETMKKILGDKGLVQFVAENPKAMVSFMQKDGITSNYGIRNKFIELVTEQNKNNITSKPPQQIIPSEPPNSEVIDIAKAIEVIETKFFTKNIASQQASQLLYDETLAGLYAIMHSSLLSPAQKAHEAWIYLYEEKDKNHIAWNAINDLGLDVNLDVKSKIPELPPLPPEVPPIPELPPLPTDPLPQPPKPNQETHRKDALLNLKNVAIENKIDNQLLKNIDLGNIKDNENKFNIKNIDLDNIKDNENKFNIKNIDPSELKDIVKKLAENVIKDKNNLQFKKDILPQKNSIEPPTGHLKDILNKSHSEVVKEYQKLSENTSTDKSRVEKWMYKKAKKVGKVFSGKDKERDKQLNEIAEVIANLNDNQGKYSNLTNYERALTLYVLLSNTQGAINKEKNTFTSGLTHLCQQYMKDLQKDFKQLENPSIIKADDLTNAQTRVSEILNANKPEPQSKKDSKKNQ